MIMGQLAIWDVNCLWGGGGIEGVDTGVRVLNGELILCKLS